MTTAAQAPCRTLGEFGPLITAADGFPRLERLALEARDHLWLSFRVFDPNTRLRLATEIGETWEDLLRHLLRNGVSVRVLLSDFDPVVGPELHEGSARSAALFSRLEVEGDIQTMMVRHEARVGKSFRFGLWLPAARALEQQRKAMNDMSAAARADTFAHRPGIWRYLRMNRDGRLVWRLWRLPRLFPATFHQKVAVMDHRAAIVGGLDIDERRFDDPSHERAADETWHDVSLHVTGDVVADISHHIASCWNQNRLRMKALRREQSRHAPPNGMHLTAPLRPLDLPKTGDAVDQPQGIRLLRTISVQKRRVGLRFSPETSVCEIEQAHVQAIRSAQKTIYIETQFLRSKTIADALAGAARRNPTVNLVLILPAAPEEIAFENNLRLTERMGEYVQAQCLKTVQDAFGARAAILSPVRPVSSTSKDRDTLHGAEIVYVHSKVLIVDDVRCIVGSANLNGRSMRWDTEAAVECTDSAAVRALRRAVLKHWLPDGAHQDFCELEDMARHWAELAHCNARRAPERRKGFLVPHDPRPAEQVGMAVPFVPDALV